MSPVPQFSSARRSLPSDPSSLHCGLLYPHLSVHVQLDGGLPLHSLDRAHHRSVIRSLALVRSSLNISSLLRFKLLRHWLLLPLPGHLRLPHRRLPQGRRRRPRWKRSHALGLWCRDSSRGRTAGSCHLCYSQRLPLILLIRSCSSRSSASLEEVPFSAASLSSSCKPRNSASRGRCTPTHSPSSPIPFVFHRYGSKIRSKSKRAVQDDKSDDDSA